MFPILNGIGKFPAYVWWLYAAGQLNSITTVLSLPLLRGKGRKYNAEGSRVEIRVGRSLNNYHHGQNKLDIERLM